MPGEDCYFNNDSMLNQFDSFFQIVEFKTEYNHPFKNNIEIVVDNTRTNIAQTVNIYKFRLS